MLATLKKHKHVLLNLFMLCIFSLGAVLFCEEIQIVKGKLYTIVYSIIDPQTSDQFITLEPANVSGNEWFVDAPMIYHAGGEIHGGYYTNFREAVEETLSEGNHFIEIDFEYTSDGHLVCAHSWPDVYLADTQPTLEEFLSTKIQGRFTPMTAVDLIQVMRENPQMYLVTDIKNDDICTPLAELVALADEDPTILSRFIIQLYTGREKSSIKEIYPFQDYQFLFTLYRWGAWKREAVKICNEENISVITSSIGTIPDEDVAMLRDLGFTLYEHTVNRIDQAKFALERGISGFYTDNLDFSDLTS